MENPYVILCAYFVIWLLDCSHWLGGGGVVEKILTFPIRSLSKRNVLYIGKPLVLITELRPLKRLLSTTTTHHQMHFWRFSDFHLVFRPSTHYIIPAKKKYDYRNIIFGVHFLTFLYKQDVSYNINVPFQTF